MQHTTLKHILQRMSCMFKTTSRVLSVKNVSGCWSCNHNAVAGTFFCAKCGVLQECNSLNTSVDFFKLLGVERSFNLDSTALTTKFRKLQNLLHPDRFSNKSTREQDVSLEWSSFVNKAYKTLSAPFKRAEYILQLDGISLPQDNSALDKAFLMEMMERNEEVEETDQTEELDKILDKLKHELDELTKELNNRLATKQHKEAISILVQMKYLMSLETTIKEKKSRKL